MFVAFEVPSQLRDLLAGSPYEGATYTFLGKASEVLEDNKTPFFPAFTDHGKTHVERVVAAAVRLVPDPVWKKGVLRAEDAVAIIAGCALHDFAMHLREPGFATLVSADWSVAPLPWFAKPHGTMPADEPWSAAWASFCREARHFSQSQLTRILGPGHGGIPPIVIDPQLPPLADWTESDRLLVGEFLRRHHARLAHEIAHNGMPGDNGSFPVLKTSLPSLADICGAIARSHNLSLRQAAEYLDYVSPGNLRPSGVLATYVMALLRIADYLQLDADRAPALLLRLKQPQSPLSIDEWNKHGAIASISWHHKDRAAFYFDISSAHSLRTHLQLEDLLDGLQRELDSAVAVLDEIYSADDFRELRLARHRVYSNLHEPSLHDQLPYVPKRAALRSAEDLFRLVIGDLYGHEPAVAGRELLQNAADAVRERARWEATHGAPALPARVDEADVLVEIRQVGDDRAELLVADNGVGMTPDTVIDYFLQAGASLRPSAEELADATPQQRVEWMRAGRFGVGAFAAFLLGREITVRTRHISAPRGVEFRVQLEGDLVQLNYADIPFVGTEITIPFDPSELPEVAWDDSLLNRLRRILGEIASFYVLQEPHAHFRMVTADEVVALKQPHQFPAPKAELSGYWRRIDVPEFDDVQWCASVNVWGPAAHGFTGMCHNGIELRSPGWSSEYRTYRFRNDEASNIVKPPGLSVFDSRHLLGVTLHRFGLARDFVPFEDPLLRSIGRDIVAAALVGEKRHPLGTGWGCQPVYRRAYWIPLIPDLIRRRLDSRLLVVWPEGSEWRTKALSEPIANDLSTVSWDDVPARVVLTPSPGFPGTRLDLRVARAAIAHFARMTGATHACTVAAYPKGRRLPVVTERDGRVTYMIDSTSNEEAVVLDEIWRELSGASDARRFAVSFFDMRPDANSAVSLLAEAWESTIGGFLPRSKSAREHLAEEVFKRDPAMRELARTWGWSMES